MTLRRERSSASITGGTRCIITGITICSRYSASIGSTNRFASAIGGLHPNASAPKRLAYHATQVFVALFIPGMFACLAMISRRFFAKLSLGMYLFLAAVIVLLTGPARNPAHRYHARQYQKQHHRSGCNFLLLPKRLHRNTVQPRFRSYQK